MDLQNRWFERKNRGIRGNVFASTSERRLVFFVGESVVVKDIGQHRVPFFSPIDGIGMANMTPQSVGFKLTEALYSKDSVHLGVSVQAILVIKDETRSIAIAAAAAHAQEAVVRAELARAAQPVLARCRYVDISSQLSAISNDILRVTRASLGTSACCFELKGHLVESVAPLDKTRADLVSGLARTEETAEIAARQQSSRSKATESELSLEALRRTHSLEHEKASREADLAHEERVAEFVHNDASRRSALLKTEEGRLAIDPELALRMRAQDIELERARIEAAARVDVEKSRAEARLYQTLHSEGAARVRERAEILGKIVPGLLASVTKVHIELPTVDESVGTAIDEGSARELPASDEEEGL